MTNCTEVSLTHHDAIVPTLIFQPEGDGPHPAVVLAPEAYGINVFMRQVGTNLAAAGYVAVVPDYYRGKGLSKPDDYSDFTEVMGFIEDLDFVGATRDVLAAVDHARGLGDVDPDRVAVWGYCTGATLAMLAASLDRNLGAAVLFFPSQPTFPELTAKCPAHPINLLWGIECPVLVIYGDKDEVAPAEVLDDFRSRLTQWEVNHQMNIYPGAGHAFSSPDPVLLHEQAAATSWKDALEFVGKNL